MGYTNKLSKQDVLHLAKLANLKLTDEEVEKLESTLGETIEYVKNLSELDTSSVSPTNDTTSLKNIYFEDGTQNSRSLSTEEALQNAKNIKSGAFVVPRIME